VSDYPNWETKDGCLLLEKPLAVPQGRFCYPI
jgi:hypothetical protein